MGGKRLLPGINDLATTMPEVAAQWDQERNGDLRPCDVMAGSDKRVWWKCSRGHLWRTAVYHRKAGHGCPNCTAQKGSVKTGVNDLVTKAPELAAQWDDVKNAPLSPHEITCYSQQKIWWRCSFGHSWCTTVSHRYQGEGCPVCCGHKLLSGFNDLAATNPELAAEWNYEKNGDLRPEQVMAGSNTKVWWKCQYGHEWYAALYSRKAGSGCPYCAGNILTPGVNDLQSARPDLLAEWDFERNLHISPDQVTAFSARKAWWKCTLGHSWHACVYSRSSGKGCPYCAGRKVLPGFNDCASKHPELALEWDSVKNAPLTLQDVTASSHRRVWWRDAPGHSWQASVANRISGTGCPFCAGKQVLIGFNDLASQKPHIAAEWANELNGTLTPQMVTVGSNRSAWWRCRLRHEWKATIISRQKNGCPVCGNRAVLQGFNDLATVHPELLCEWDYDKNGTLLPTAIVFSSHKKVWWKCILGHSWRTKVYTRHMGANCPVCAAKIDKHMVIPGKNDFFSLATSLLPEWDVERNDTLSPDQVLLHSNRKVWWKCKNDHHWRASLNQRYRGNGCPYCSGRMPSRRHLVP